MKASIVPETLEASRTQLHVPDGVPHVAMPQVRLDQPKISPALRQVVTARVPESVRMDVQGGEACPLRHAIEHQLNRPGCHRPAPLRDKNPVTGLWSFALQAPQCPDFQSAQAMVARYAAFGAPDVENALLQVELAPASLQSLLNAEPVREQHHNKGGIPMSPPVLSRGLDELLDFVCQQVLTESRPALRDCSRYGDWHHVAHARNPQYFHRVACSDCS